MTFVGFRAASAPRYLQRKGVEGVGPQAKQNELSAHRKLSLPQFMKASSLILFFVSLFSTSLAAPGFSVHDFDFEYGTEKR